MFLFEKKKKKDTVADKVKAAVKAIIGRDSSLDISGVTV